MSNSTTGIPVGSAVGAVLFGLAHLFVHQPNAVAIGYTAFTIAEIAPHLLWSYNTTASKVWNIPASSSSLPHYPTHPATIVDELVCDESNETPADPATIMDELVCDADNETPMEDHVDSIVTDSGPSQGVEQSEDSAAVLCDADNETPTKDHAPSVVTDPGRSQDAKQCEDSPPVGVDFSVPFMSEEQTARLAQRRDKAAELWSLIKLKASHRYAKLASAMTTYIQEAWARLCHYTRVLQPLLFGYAKDGMSTLWTLVLDLSDAATRYIQEAWICLCHYTKVLQPLLLGYAKDGMSTLWTLVLDLSDAATRYIQEAWVCLCHYTRVLQPFLLGYAKGGMSAVWTLVLGLSNAAMTALDEIVKIKDYTTLKAASKAARTQAVGCMAGSADLIRVARVAAVNASIKYCGISRTCHVEWCTAPPWLWRAPVIVMLTSLPTIVFILACRSWPTKFLRSVFSVLSSIAMAYMLSFVPFFAGIECTQDLILAVITFGILWLLYCFVSLPPVAVAAIDNGWNGTVTALRRMILRPIQAVLGRLHILPLAWRPARSAQGPPNVPPAQPEPDQSEAQDATAQPRTESREFYLLVRVLALFISTKDLVDTVLATLWDVWGEFYDATVIGHAQPIPDVSPPPEMGDSTTRGEEQTPATSQQKDKRRAAKLRMQQNAAAAEMTINKKRSEVKKNEAVRTWIDKSKDEGDATHKSETNPKPKPKPTPKPAPKVEPKVKPAVTMEEVYAKQERAKEAELDNAEAERRKAHEQILKEADFESERIRSDVMNTLELEELHTETAETSAQNGAATPVNAPRGSFAATEPEAPVKETSPPHPASDSFKKGTLNLPPRNTPLASPVASTEPEAHVEHALPPQSTSSIFKPATFKYPLRNTPPANPVASTEPEAHVEHALPRQSTSSIFKKGTLNLAPRSTPLANPVASTEPEAHVEQALPLQSTSSPFKSATFILPPRSTPLASPVASTEPEAHVEQAIPPQSTSPFYPPATPNTPTIHIQKSTPPKTSVLKHEPLNVEDFPLPNLYQRPARRPSTGINSNEELRNRLLGGPSNLTQMRRRNEAAAGSSPNNGSGGSGGDSPLANPPPSAASDGGKKDGDYDSNKPGDKGHPVAVGGTVATPALVAPQITNNRTVDDIEMSGVDVPQVPTSLDPKLLSAVHNWNSPQAEPLKLPEYEDAMEVDDDISRPGSQKKAQTTTPAAPAAAGNTDMQVIPNHPAAQLPASTAAQQSLPPFQPQQLIFPPLPVNSEPTGTTLQQKQSPGPNIQPGLGASVALSQPAATHPTPHQSRPTQLPSAPSPIHTNLTGSKPGAPASASPVNTTSSQKNKGSSAAFDGPASYGYAPKTSSAQFGPSTPTQTAPPSQAQRSTPSKAPGRKNESLNLALDPSVKSLLEGIGKHSPATTSAAKQGAQYTKGMGPGTRSAPTRPSSSQGTGNAGMGDVDNGEDSSGEMSDSSSDGSELLRQANEAIDALGAADQTLEDFGIKDTREIDDQAKVASIEVMEKRKMQVPKGARKPKTGSDLSFHAEELSSRDKAL